MLFYCRADVEDGGPTLQTTLGQFLVFAGMPAVRAVGHIEPKDNA